MAATITVTCPECDTTIKTAAEVAGKKVRCKSCGEVFVAKAKAPAGTVKKAAAKPAPAQKPAKEVAAPAPKPTGDDEDDGKAYGLTETDLSPRCPHCANELESAEAKVCLNCGYNTETREQSKTKKVEEVTGFDTFLWLLPGILCALGVLFLFVFDILFALYITEWVDAENTWYGAMLAHGSVKVWGGILSVAIMLGLARFAIQRLIRDRVPPEVEVKDSEKEKNE